MIKVIKIDGRDLDNIEKLLNNNPSWKLLTCGSNKFSKTYSTRGVMYSDPPETRNFMVVESIGDEVKEFVL